MICTLHLQVFTSTFADLNKNNKALFLDVIDTMYILNLSPSLQRELDVLYSRTVPLTAVYAKKNIISKMFC